ncbi:MAG: carbohydrate ABC transporter permease [Cellulosilyticaceae bacterium]
MGGNDKANKRIGIGRIFVQGDVWTKLSFLIMGIGNLVRGQIVKGLLYLGIEIGFIAFLVTAGIKNMKGLVTLGTTTQGWVMDEQLGIEVLTKGDNSMLMLIYGVSAVVLMALFLVIYVSNLYSAKYVQDVVAAGKKPATLKDEMKSLLDERFHISLMTLPVLGIVIFTVLPLIFMILIAFTNYDSAHQPPGNLFTWVGFANFKDMLMSNSKFGQTFMPVLGWTLTWAVGATFSNYILGILLAMMINKKGICLKKMWRTIFVLTMAIPQFISLLIMRNMLNDFGPINAVLQNMGLIDHAIPFLSSATGARISVLLVNLWIGIPYTMLITSGILMNIPSDLYEAARIDGASSYQAFRKITMPYVLFVTAPYLITQFIGNINNFNVIYLLTAGEPKTTDYYFAGKTDLLITWLYKLTADRKDYSKASTIGIVVFIISMVFSLIAFNFTSSQKKEDDFQ